MGAELRHGDDLGLVIRLLQPPDKDIARRVGRAEQSSVARYRDARYRKIVLGGELVGARVFGQIPYPYAAGPVATDDLALVRMDDDVIGRRAVAVAALDGARPRFPDLDRPVLRARHHPFALAVERHARDVARVALERQQRVRVGRLDVIKLHRVVPGRSEKAFVGRDA